MILCILLLLNNYIYRRIKIIIVMLKNPVCLCNFQSINQSIYRTLECGPMPNLMVALPNIGGALCSTPQSLADAHY